MKKALAIAGILVLTITPKASFPDHLEPKQSEIRPRSNLNHTTLSRRNLSGADLRFTDLSNADLSGSKLIGADLSGADMVGANLSRADLNSITSNNLSGCPWRLPSEWVCQNNSLILR